MYEYIIQNEKQTAEFASKLTKLLQKGDILALVGDLGTGKTTLTKYIAKELGITEDITSPTFNIVKEHTGGKLPLYHFDVYRLKNAEEMHEIGYEDYFYGDGICVVEWADIVQGIIPETAYIIFMQHTDDENVRIYQTNIQV